MLLYELLDKKVPYKIKQARTDLFMTIAKIGGREIIFTAEAEADYKGEWSVSFLEKSEDENGPSINFGKTGSGNELEVFSMVKDSLSEFIQTYTPKSINFVADKEDGENRSNLYTRLLDRFKIPGYSVKRHSVNKFGAKYDTFEIIKDATK